MRTKTFALLTVGYVIFVLYGSLVPFDYMPLSWEEAWTRWREVCARPLGADSRTDFATNVILFVPLGFLFVGTFSVYRGRVFAVLVASLVIPSCTALSAAIEFTQLEFPARVSSLNDVLAESIGAVIGSLVWIAWGRRITDYVESVWVAWGPDNLAVKLLPAYVFFLVLIHVMPLDLSISPAEIYRKWKQGRVILVPFTTDYGSIGQCVFKTTWNLVYFAPMGWLLSLWPQNRFANSWRVLASGTFTAGAVEFLQLFVRTRYCDVTDIITGTIGVWIAWCFCQAWQANQPGSVLSALRSRPTLLRASMLLAWFVLLAWLDWYPFNVVSASSAAVAPRTPSETSQRKNEFVISEDGRYIRNKDGTQTFAVNTIGPFVLLADWQDVQQRWQATPLLPLVDLFVGSEYHAFDELVRKSLQFMYLGALLVPTAGARNVIWRALAAGFLLSSLFEAGQLFVPDRVCSASDVVIETAGTVLGFLLFRRLLVLTDGESEASAPAAESEGIPMSLGVIVRD
jgi:VanZ family protein